MLYDKNLQELTWSNETIKIVFPWSEIFYKTLSKFSKIHNFYWKRTGDESTQESSAFPKRTLVATSSKTVCIKYLKITWQRALSCNYILLKSSNSLSFPRAIHSCYYMHSKDKASSPGPRHSSLHQPLSWLTKHKDIAADQPLHWNSFLRQRELLILLPQAPEWQGHSKLARERPAGVIHVLLPCANIPLLRSICNNTALKFSVPLLSHLWKSGNKVSKLEKLLGKRQYLILEFTDKLSLAPNWSTAF